MAFFPLHSVKRSAHPLNTASFENSAQKQSVTFEKLLSQTKSTSPVSANDGTMAPLQKANRGSLNRALMNDWHDRMKNLTSPNQKKAPQKALNPMTTSDYQHKALENSPHKTEIKSAVAKASKEFELPENLLFSVMRAESYFNPKAVSKANAKGLMQLIPSTAESMGVKNIFNIEENVRGGAKYLRKMLNRYDQDLKKALAAYNAGPGNVDKHKGIPPFKETQNYVSKINQWLKESS